MKLIPDALVELIDSKKAALLLFLFAAWTPAGMNLTGMSEAAMQWFTIGFVGYAIAQGIADHGLASCGKKKEARERWRDSQPPQSPQAS